jgi:ribonuclease P/MRP protein subunit RPP40
MPIDVVYLDFEKAFDKVSHSLLLVKLQHNGIRGSLLKWISAFLRNRKFYVKIGSASSAMQDVVSGVPQGSVLGANVPRVHFGLNSTVEKQACPFRG